MECFSRMEDTFVFIIPVSVVLSCPINIIMWILVTGFLSISAIFSHFFLFIPLFKISFFSRLYYQLIYIESCIIVYCALFLVVASYFQSKRKTERSLCIGYLEEIFLASESWLCYKTYKRQLHSHCKPVVLKKDISLSNMFIL